MFRTRHGRNRIFATPAILWKEAVQYFEWCEVNPLYKTEAFAYQGRVVLKDVPVLRAMSFKGLCLYLNVNQKYFIDFKKSLAEDEEDFSQVIERIESVIYNQKFEGAAAGLLKENIIARDLQLKDSTDISTLGKEIKPNFAVNFAAMSSEALEEIERNLIEKE